MTPGQYFRAGVGLIVIDGLGHVLAIERGDVPGAWQLPQGGMERDEEPDETARRELHEETGLGAADVELLDHTTQWLAYELPAAHRSKKTGRGQAQQWFLFRAKRPEIESLPGPADAGEVRGLRWMSPDDLLAGAAAFRVDVYRAVLERFAARIAAGDGTAT